MFRKIFSKTKRAFTAVYFGLLIVRWCGLRLSLRKIVRQLYARWVYLVVIAPLDNPVPPSSFECTVSLATPDDISELFNGLHTENPEGRYQLLLRKWYHTLGIGDCYITRATETNEICAVRWVVTPESVRKLGWEYRYPLGDDELTTENVYTFERYRRLGAELAASIILQEVYRKRGFKYSIAYIDETNTASLRMSEKSGDKVRARMLVRRFLFHDIRKTIQRYSPPITATEVLGMK